MITIAKALGGLASMAVVAVAVASGLTTIEQKPLPYFVIDLTKTTIVYGEDDDDRPHLELNGVSIKHHICGADWRVIQTVRNVRGGGSIFLHRNGFVSRRELIKTTGEQSFHYELPIDVRLEPGSYIYESTWVCLNPEGDAKPPVLIGPIPLTVGPEGPHASLVSTTRRQGSTGFP